jgi:hypothetical protein
MPGPARRTRLFALAPHSTAQDSPFVMHAYVAAARPGQPVDGLPREWQAAIVMCQAPRAVAEVAARLELPLVTVTALLTELAAWGLVVHQPPMTKEEATDVAQLRRIRDALAAI